VRHILQLVGCALALSLGSTPAWAQTARPNILIVLFDDVGFTDFGTYGSDTRTPNIDAVARRGAMLSRYYTSPFCGPSRAMLMTGLDNHQTGMGTLVETLQPELRARPGYTMTWDRGQKTIASLLAAAGYQTYVTGKWGIGEVGANLPHEFGFQRSYVMDATGGSNFDRRPYLPGYDAVSWFEDGKPVELPEDFYSSRSLVDKLIEYIDAGTDEQPFFAFLSLQAVHIPVQVPVNFVDAYNGTFDRGWDAMRAERHSRAIRLGLVPPTTTLAAVPATHRKWDALSAAERERAARKMQVNAGMIEAADQHIGRLLAHLEAAGELDNTIVVITSDNGPESAETDLPGAVGAAISAVNAIEGTDQSTANIGQPGSLSAIGPEWAAVAASPFNLYKFYAGEGGLRVPLVVAGPGIAQQGVVGAPVHVADLLPTLLDAAEVRYDPAGFYGRSALPLFEGGSQATYGADESFAFEVSGNAALYRGQWKITRNAPPRGDARWRLYDISADPGETKDLAAANPELFASMKAEYAAYARRVGVVELDPEASAMKELTSKLAAKSLGKYWPYLLGFVIALAASLYGLVRLAKRALRPKPA
jgi:arylsulfatase A-like enzyme